MATNQSWRTCTAGDPKFWPAYIRHITLANICIFVFLGNFYAAGIATGFVSLAQEFHVEFSKLTDTISYPVLALGVGNLFWTPTAVCFGKRPVIIVSMAMFLGCAVWSIYAKTLDELVAARVLACFGAGSIESIGPAIIADLYMERYFATAMAVFSLFLSGGSQVGPMIAGFLIKSRGWRWFFRLNGILIGANLAATLVLLPETNYQRAMFKGETAAEVDKLAVHQVENKKEASDQVAEPADANLSGEPIRNAPYAGSYFKDLVAFANRGLENGVVSWAKQFSLPFRFILVPHALFAAGSYGVFLGGIVIISTFVPQLLSPPPYLLTSSGIGLFSLGTFVGIVVGYPIAGPLTDLLSRIITRRRGRHEPEHRIPALIVPFALAPPGLLLFAYIINQHRSFYIACVGAAMQAASMVFVPSVVLSVVVDAYPDTGSEALVLINAGKNLIAFAITVRSPYWLMSTGLVKMFWQMAAAQWAVLVLGLPLFIFGPWLRRKTLFLI